MSAILADFASPPAAWRRPVLIFTLSVLALLLLYRETAVAMVGIWSRSDTFAHAFLVPPISAWLVWRNRDRLAVIQPRPALIWLLPLALAALAWMLGQLVVVNALTQFALVTLLVLLVPLNFGWPATRAMLFPLLFLFFCVPVGEFLLPVLMERTADFTVAALRLSGVPVFREGLQFVIPSGNWSVVEACSGVRYLIASMMVGSLFAYLNYQSMTRRLMFVGVSILVPIVANWVRAYIIVMLGHLSDNRIATGVDHLVYGWVFFGVVITIMFMIGSRWSEPDRPLVKAADPGFDGRMDALPSARLLPVLIGALLVAALPHIGLRAAQAGASTAPVQLMLPPAARAGWVSSDGAAVLRPQFAGAAKEVQAHYQREGRAVDVYLAYYRTQGQDRKLVSSVNVLIPSEDTVWHPIEVTTRETVVDGQTLHWRSTHVLGKTGGVAAPRRHLTVWQLYWVDDRFTSSDIRAKLHGAIGQLAGRGDDGAALVLQTEAAPQEGGDTLLADFVAANLGVIQQALQRAHDAR